MAIPPLVLRIVADSRGVAAGVAQTQRQMTGLRGAVQRNSGLIKTALIGGVVAGLTASVNAAREAQTAQLKLQNSLDNSTKVSGGAAAAFTEQADALRDLTGVDDEAIIGAQAFLVQMGLTEKQVTELTPLITDLSVKMGIDLDTAAKAVGKSVNGTTSGLQRMGVIVDKAKAQTDPYVATLDALGVAQGFAAEQAKVEPWRVLGAQMEEVGEAVGQAVLPALRVLADVLITLLRIVRPVAPALIAVASAFGAIWVVGKLASMARSVLDTASAFGKLLLGLGPIGGAAAAAAGSITLIALAIEGANSALDDFEKELTDLGVPLGTAKRETDVLREAQARAGPTTRFMGRRMNDLRTELQLASVAMHGAAVQAREYTGATNAAAQGDRNATKAAKDLRTARLALAGGLLGVVAGLNSLREAQRTVNELEANGKRGTEEYKDAKITLLGEIVSAKEALIDYGKELGDVPYSQVKQKLINLGTQYGLTKKDVQDVLKVVEDTNAAWARVPKNVRTEYHVEGTISGSFPPGFDPRQLEGRAAGGPVFAGRPYVVGERGPELFIPTMSGQIIANQETSGGTVVNVYGDVNDADQFARKVEHAINRSASRA